MKISRTWSTPLAAAAFTLMALTGVLMFFHLDAGVVQGLHEWGGWLLIAAIVLHLVGNATMLKAHLARTSPRVMVGAALLVVALGAALGGRGEGRGGGGNPSRVAVDHLTAAPLSALAPIAGRDVDTLVADLRAAGFEDARPESTLDGLAGDEREDRMRALSVALPPATE